MGLFLPSLLDRLRDDDRSKNVLNEIKQNLEQLNSELCNLDNSMQVNRNDSVIIKQRTNLLHQLEELEDQYYLLSASVNSEQDIRACVIRDLERLLNTSRYFPFEELEDYPEVTRSVINYGVPDLTGKTVSELNYNEIERLLLNTIINFEPRIIKDTLIIKAIVDQAKTEQNIFVIEIECEIFAKPLPLFIHARTEFELETGRVSLYHMH